MMKNILVFSIALNGYQWRYRQHLASHLRFAEKFDYHYQAVTRPTFSPLGVECCWLKLTLMLTALKAGYQGVVFLDADTFVQTSCPEIKSILCTDKYLYMAKGYSGRFNSGVMIVQNHEKIRHWLTRVINSRNDNLRPENDVGWGENGYIIEHSYDCSLVQELPHTWNNTFDADLADYIRHQNCGPLRSGAIDNFFHKIIFSLTDRIGKLSNYCKQLHCSSAQENMLIQETTRALAHYPCFSKTPTKICLVKQEILKG